MRSAVLLGVLALAAASCTGELSVSVGAPPAAADTASTGVGDGAVVGREVADMPSTAPTSSPPSTTRASRPIVLGFAGDVQMIGSMADGRPLDGVAGLLAAPDLMMVNLETVVGDADEVGPPPIDKEFLFRSPPRLLDDLAAAGVDVVGMANNHAWDHGPQGVRVTRARVDASSLVGVGVGADAATAYAPAFLDVDGTTVGVVSLTRVPCDWTHDPAADRPEVAYACDRHAIAALGAIAEAEAGGDHTVVLLHGGTESADCPDPRLREVVHTWIDLGADVVAISHPHVLQGVEVIDGAAVLWSTGNFAFRNGGGRTGRSAVFRVTLGGDEPIVELTPTVLPGGIAGIADADTAAQVRAEVSERSVGGVIDVEGRLVASAAPSRCD